MHGQTCSETFDLIDDLSINVSLATSCIRCIVGGQFATNVQWIALTDMVVLTDGMNGVTIVNGILVIDVTVAFFLEIPVSLQCGGGVHSIYPASKWL